MADHFPDSPHVYKEKFQNEFPNCTTIRCVFEVFVYVMVKAMTVVTDRTVDPS